MANAVTADTPEDANTGSREVGAGDATTAAEVTTTTDAPEVGARQDGNTLHF